MKVRSFLIAAILFPAFLFSQEITVKGTILDRDSISPMQFAYAVNKNTGTGMVADDRGQFSLRIHLGDTLAFSYVGYHVTRVHTHLLKDSVKNSVLTIRVYLRPKVNELKPVVVTSLGFSKEIKETYERRINEYKKAVSSPLTSPIDALYYTFSKKGKELQKLSALYDQLLIDEVKEARLNPETVRYITGNDTLDVRKFLSYCYWPDQFILSASDYELYLSVRKYYEGYMATEKRQGEAPK